MLAYTLQALYVLRRYHVLGGPAQRWIVILLLLAALLMAVGLLPGGPAGGLIGLLPGGPASGLIGLLLAAALLAGQRLAEGRQYVTFRPEPASLAAPATTPISPSRRLGATAAAAASRSSARKSMSTRATSNQ